MPRRSSLTPRQAPLCVCVSFQLRAVLKLSDTRRAHVCECAHVCDACMHNTCVMGRHPASTPRQAPMCMCACVHVRARACMRVYDAYPSATHTHTTPRQAPGSSCARAQAASSSWIRTSPTACQRPRSLHSTAPASALSGSSSCTPSAALMPRAAGPQRTRLSAALSGAPPRNLARRRRRSSAPSGNADVSSGRWFTCARTPGCLPLHSPAACCSIR